MCSLSSIFIRALVVAWSPSVRRGPPASKPRCRESDTRAVAGVFQTLCVWISGRKTARGRRPAASPIESLTARTMETRALLLEELDEGNYMISWASHRAYFFARSCAVQRIQNRVLHPRRFLTNGASISMVVIYHNALYARSANA